MAHVGRKAKLTQGRAPLLVAGGVGVLALLLVAFLLLRPAAVAPMSAGDDPFAGSPSAPVTAYLFEDFQCPVCAQFNDGGSFEKLKAEYADTGKVKLVVRDFPFIGEDSWHAAVAARYVWTHDPNDYWAYYHALYQLQGAENSGWASPAGLLNIARGFPNIDQAGLAAALQQDDRSHARASYDEGRDHGVSGTPTLVIDGKPVSGMDRVGIRAALDAALR